MTSSTSLLDSAALSAQLEHASANAGLKTFLQSICADKNLLGRFLNMLSMLEHIGSRKIMLTQMGGRLEQETLKHLAEETRHAYFFKRNAERFAGRELNYAPGDMLAHAAARMYFGRLDAAAARAINPAWPDHAGYILVSLLIELRAGWLYHTFDEALGAAKIPLSLKSIIAEEDMHLREMTDAAGAAVQGDTDTILGLMQTEQTLFEKFWTALQSEIQPDSLAA
jgi:hypothetical protein